MARQPHDPPKSTTQPVDYEPPSEQAYDWEFIAPPEDPIDPDPVATVDISTPPAPTYPNPKTLEVTAATGLIDTGVSEQAITTLKPGDPVPYVFGTTLVTPSIITVVKKAAGNIYVDLLLSTGECEFVDAIIQGGNRFDTDYGFSPWVLPLPGWEFHSGASGQSASPGIVAELGSYDALDGICHVVARVNQYTSMDIKFILKGLKLFDPRTSPGTTEYSNNPALALARIFVDSGYTVDWDTVADAANYCDENVGGSPFAARWTLDLAAYSRQPLDKWAHTLAQYCGGLHIDNRGGVIYLLADKPVTSSPQITHTITASDIERPRTMRAGLRNVPEKVIVNYRDEDGQAQSAIVGSGSSGRIARLQMPGFSTYTMAARFATEVLAKAQTDKIHEHVAYDQALEPTVGELADITYAPHGLSAQRMRLIDYRQIALGRWWRRYIEYSDDSYSDGAFTQPTVGTNPDLDTLEDVPAGPTPTVVQETYVAGGYERLKITFTGTSWNHVLDYRINVEGTDITVSPEEAGETVLETMIPHIGQVTHTVYTTALTTGHEYTVSVWTRSKDGKLGAATTASATAYDTTSLLTGMQAWWTLEEASGTRANSHAVASPNLYDLTEWSGVGNTTGKVNNAVDFGGNSPYGDGLYVDHSADSPMPSLMTTQFFCGCLWVKFNEIDTSPSANQRILSRGAWSTITGDDFSINLQMNYDNSPYVPSIHLSVSNQGGGLNQTIALTPDEAVIDTWYFVYFFYNVNTLDFGGSVNDGQVYTSGVSPLDTDTIGNDLGVIKLGMFLNNASYYQHLNGQMDEVVMWIDRELSADDITWLYNSGAGRTYSDL